MEAVEAPKRAGRSVHIDEVENLMQRSEQCFRFFFVVGGLPPSRTPRLICCSFVLLLRHWVGGSSPIPAVCSCCFFLHLRSVSGGAPNDL